jgi:hypothetical protein
MKLLVMEGSRVQGAKIQDPGVRIQESEEGFAFGSVMVIAALA